MQNRLPSAAGVLIAAAVIATTTVYAYQAPPLDDASAVASLPLLPNAAEPSATSHETWRRRISATTIGDSKLGESTPAAPNALNGFIFIGNAGGDKGLERRMYALNSRTGEIVWEFYLVPKSVDDQARGPQRATWTSYTLDPVTGELFVSGGNSGPDAAMGLRESAYLIRIATVVRGDVHDAVSTKPVPFLMPQVRLPAPPLVAVQRICPYPLLSGQTRIESEANP